MSKIRTQKAYNLLKSIKDKESELFELMARYHLAFVGIDNPTSRVLSHTIDMVSHVFVRASVVLGNSLTKREQSYLELAARGYKVKEIADRLKISISTAKTNRDLILQKLFCKNITEAVSLIRKYQIH